ncbi:putative pyridoxamine 5'-phosphate oxidase family protein [Lactobacillus colini]|uniref:Pyridoxamine 5'-phosphate oxidase family protein n=1 Tax=Lactobacillus colini TaxID=1819254 RepID=A0ABS4MCA4_9LACO|nr:hypothetical protein [Lactobacillus colini]MBP2057299.1 putative pyridoxamine 5'-phosphate oxidase family protein [Lactobacillus colini]
MSVSILNNQTTNSEFLKFAVDEIHNVVISTVSNKKLPSAQVCDLLFTQNGKLYITTSKNNHPFFDDLDKSTNVLVTGYKGDGTMDSCGFSINAKVRNIHQELLDLAFEKNPYLYEIYQDNIAKAKQALQIFEITPKTAGYLDHRTKPIFYREFKF